MSNTLLVAGCSIAYGLSTYSYNSDIKNTKYSFAKYFADYLKCEYLNVSWPGVSNEFIFHRAISNINNNIKKLLVCWTANGRESWENEHEIWKFHVCYSNYEQKNNKELFVDNINNSKIVSSIESNIIDVSKMQHYFLKKIVSEDYETKLKNYSLSLKSICDKMNIEYIEVKVLHNNLDCFYITEDCLSIKKSLHPDRNDHKKIANKLIEHYEKTRKQA